MENIDFSNVKPPFLSFVDVSISAFEDLMTDYRKKMVEGYVAILRGHRMQTFQELYAEMAAVLQFPYYFGNNWNALIECLQDMSWIPRNFYLLGIAEKEKILSRESKDDVIAFFKLLEDTCIIFSKPFEVEKKWGRPACPMHILLQVQN